MNKVLKDPFKWDGSYLGEIIDDCILRYFYHETLEYWILSHDGYATICQVRKTKKYTHCLVDELKPLFGLIKLGTHYGKYKTGYVILIRARLNLTEDRIVLDLPLSMCPNLSEPLILDRIKQIYIFRDLLCLSKSTDSSIVLRVNEKNKDLVYPVSLIDSAIDLEKMSNFMMSTYLPEVAFSRWIKDESPSLILRRMCNVYNSNTVISRIYKLKEDIVEITKRVCGYEFMDFPDILTNRILAKVNYSGKIV